jgi:hypothetical protein
MGGATDATILRAVAVAAALLGLPGPAWPAPSDSPNPGSAATIEIAIDPVRREAGGEATTTVLVRVRDSAGNLTDAKVTLESDLAKVGKPIRFERGVYSALVTVPRGTLEPVKLTARAGQAVASASFSGGAAVAAIRVAQPGPFRAESSSGGPTIVLDIWVVDASGNPMPDPPRGSGGRGQFGGATHLGPGHFVLSYRPPRIFEDTTEEVVITAGSSSTTVKLELLARRNSLTGGVKAGLAVAGGGLGPAVGLEAGAWTQVGRSHLGLVIDGSWWMQSSSSTAMVGAAASTYSSTQHYPSILLSAAWRTRLPGRWMLWATVGGGGGLVTNSAKLEGQPTVSESGFAPVASGALSVTPLRGPGAFFLEGRATWFGDPGLSTLSGSTTTFLALLGYRFDVD